MEQKPTVGRIVHYFPGSSESIGEGPVAAIITAVEDGLREGLVDLTVFPRRLGVLSLVAVAQRAPGLTTSVWDWPERA